jgi:hypothetical protein
MTILEILAAVALCCAIFCLICVAKRKLLLPKTGSKDVTITTVVRAKGESPCLEQTVGSLVWLRQSGMDMDIVIEDAGLTARQRQMAEILAREKDVALIQAPTDGTDHEFSFT